MPQLSIGSNNGQAYFRGYQNRPNGDPFEAYEVAAVPGAAKAREKWLAHNAAAKKIMARIKPSSEVVLQARRDRKAERITQAQLDAVEAAHLEIYKDADEHAREGAKLALEYARLIENSGLDTKALAASVVAENTPKIREALDVIRELYPLTRSAYEVAGLPGADPRRKTGAMADLADGGFSYGLRALEVLASFDVDAAAAMADGAEVVTQRDLDRDAAERAKGDFAKAKATIRVRNARGT